jgi:predicted MFS family arabinose efflux permease
MKPRGGAGIAAAAPPAHAASARAGFAILGGVSATFLGVGLQRFAYSPLLPAMIAAHWVGAGAGGALAGANLGGYLLGALAAPMLGRLLGVRLALRLAMLGVTACFALCAWPGGFWWLLPWRVLAGVVGGVLMVLAGPAVQAIVPLRLRGLASGLTFVGVGLGIMAGAGVVPALLPSGLSAAWLALAATSLAIAGLAWWAWPPNLPPPAAAGTQRGINAERSDGVEKRATAWLLITVYALAATASSAHMFWWPDFIARGLGWGAKSGAWFWLLYGFAGIAGTVLCGRFADLFGTRRALLGALCAQAAAVALPLFRVTGTALVLSTLLAGSTIIGLTALVLIRAREIAGEGAARLWGINTAAFGAAQTAAGFLFAWVYAVSGSHFSLFGIALVAALLAIPLAFRA